MPRTRQTLTLNPTPSVSRGLNDFAKETGLTPNEAAIEMIKSGLKLVGDYVVEEKRRRRGVSMAEGRPQSAKPKGVRNTSTAVEEDFKLPDGGWDWDKIGDVLAECRKDAEREIEEIFQGRDELPAAESKALWNGPQAGDKPLQRVRAVRKAERKADAIRALGMGIRFD